MHSLVPKGLTKSGNCLMRIRGVAQSAKSAEKRLAEYIMNAPESILELSIEELAAKSNTSYATISRFCKKLGFSGYKEMKAALEIDAKSEEQSVDIAKEYRLQPGMTTEQVCENVYGLAFRILEDSFTILSTSIIEEVTVHLTKARRICFLGTGNSGISAQYANSKFFRIGLNCFFEKDATLSSMYVSQLSAGDLLFVISSSGRTVRMIEAAKIAKSNAATVVSLSDFSISPLSKLADINLFTTNRSGQIFMNIDLPLTIGQITLIDLLYMSCCLTLGETANVRYEQTKALGDSEKAL